MRPACLLSVLLLATTATTAADARRPIREARSDNGAFCLRIDPGRPGRPTGRCEATLEGRGDGGGPRRWSRPLVNEVGPMQAFVRNDGRYVVTLDEAGYGGARHALVIYGPQGELLRHFLLTDLLAKSDWRHVQVRGRELVWLRGARCTFDSPADHFEIELRWGRAIRIDLRTLAVIAEDRAAAAGDDVPPAVAEALFTLDAADEPVEAGAASRPPGSELGTLTPDDEERARAVQAELAGEATPVGRESGDVRTELPGAEPVVAEAEPAHAEGAPGEMSGDAGQAEPASGATDAGLTPVVADPEAAELTGIAVPLPNPAARTDYLAWLNALANVTESNAATLYEQAFARFVPFEGDGDLLRAAQRGDPTALAAPEIQAWIAANAGALEAFRAGALQDACGWTYHSEDGTMLGVLVPNPAHLRSLAQAELIDGRALAQQGEAAAAAERYLNVAAAGRHLGSGMTVIENLVGAVLQAQAADALLDLQSDPTAGAQLDYAALVREARAAYQPLRSLAEVVQTERAALLDVAQRLWSPDPQTGAWQVDRARLAELLQMNAGDATTGSDPTRGEEFAAALERAGFEATVAAANALYDRVTRTLQQPYAEGRRELAALESELEHESANPLLRTLVPSMERYHFLMTRSEAQRRAALVVTELNAYRQRTGRYPASLDVLATDALDPFTGRPFVFRGTADGFTLYSVGGNGVDDAGRHDPQSPDADIVFWPRPR